MRIYIGSMAPGEIPRLCVQPHLRVLTIEEGEVRSARAAAEGTMCYAYERWFTEPHDLGWDDAGDLIDHASQWNYLRPSLDFRPTIREELINELRLMGTRAAIVFVRCYGISGTDERTCTTLAAGVLGMDIDPQLEGPVFHGPFWDSLFERNLDLVLEGAEYPPGMKRYVITPLGRIINPWPKSPDGSETWDGSKLKG